MSKDLDISRNKVNISNVLIDAKFALTKSEIKLVLIVVSLIRERDEDFKDYEISFKNLKSIIGDGNHKQLKSACSTIMKKLVMVKKPNGGFETFSWFSYLSYAPERSCITVRFDKALKPYLLELKGNFLDYTLCNVLQLRSSYTTRLYQMLKAYQGIGKRTIKFETICENFMLPKSLKSYGQFKPYILKSQKELEKKTDISFEFEEIKNSRKVEAIKFYISVNRERQAEEQQTKEFKIFVKKARRRLSGESLNVLVEGNTTYISNEGLLYLRDEDGELVSLNSDEALRAWKSIYEAVNDGKLEGLRERVYGELPTF